MFLANYNSVKDFEENVMKFIDSFQGITSEQLSKKLKISLILSRLKLEVLSIKTFNLNFNTINFLF